MSYNIIFKSRYDLVGFPSTDGTARSSRGVSRERHIITCALFLGLHSNMVLMTISYGLSLSPAPRTNAVHNLITDVFITVLSSEHDPEAEVTFLRTLPWPRVSVLRLVTNDRRSTFQATTHSPRS